MHIRLRPRPYRPVRRAPLWVGTKQSISVAAGAATTTATANQAAANVAPNAGTTAATATANNAALSLQTSAGIGSVSATAGGGAGSVAVGPTVASATGTAYNATVSTSAATNANAEVASATATANNAAISEAPNSGAGSATGTANNAAPSLATSAGAGSVSASAGGGAGSVAVGPTAASATGTAYNATVQTGTFTNASAGAGSATATSYDPGKTVAVNAGVASATGTAYNATVSTAAATNASAGLASATGTAYNATISVKTSAGVATITVTAYNPSVSDGIDRETLSSLVRVHRPSTLRYPATVTYVDYLDATVGTATTPDPGVPPNDCTFVFKVRGPTTANNTVAAQYDADPQRSWLLRRHATDTGVYWNVTPTGLAAGGVTRAVVIGAVTPTADQYQALSITVDNGSAQTVLTPSTSTDGSTWTSGTTGTFATTAVFDSNGVVRIGDYTGGGETFTGRIYYVELRTGLDPAAGSVLWRFDAEDYPGTGTSYTDPRGRTWTLTSASAIKTTQSDVHLAHPLVRIRP